MLTDFQNSFTVGFGDKFLQQESCYISDCTSSVSVYYLQVPCEIHKAH